MGLNSMEKILTEFLIKAGEVQYNVEYNHSSREFSFRVNSPIIRLGDMEEFCKELNKMGELIRRENENKEESNL